MERSDYAATAARARLREAKRAEARARRLRDSKKERSDYAATAARARLREAKLAEASARRLRAK